MIKIKKETVGELIYGIHPLIEVLKAKRRKIITIYTTKPVPKAWDQIAAMMPSYPVPIQYVEREVLHRMAESTDHQGVVAWVQPFVFRKKFFEPAKAPCLVMLDGIQDPRNVGAILRSVYCTGFDGVIMVKKGAAPLSATAFKSSAGLAEHLDIIIASSAKVAALELRNAGYTLYLATLDGQNAATCQYTRPLCLVIGNEAVGIEKEILSMGIRVTLPQKTADISYNASVAAGILLFLVASQQAKV